MIRDLELALADALGAAMTAPFAGRVRAAPDAAPGNGPRVRVAVRAAEPVEPDMGAARPEVAPGVGDPRRIVRLRCSLSVEFLPEDGAGRAQQLLGLDQALYLLDSPPFRRAEALAGAADPGFRLDYLRPTGVTAPPDPAAQGAPPVEIRLEAEGWFWPPGVPGEAGAPIAELVYRSVTLPIVLTPARPLLTAGGTPVELTLTFGHTDRHRLGGAEGLAAADPFGTLFVSLRAPGGRPPAGTLSGGAAAPGGARLLAVAAGSVRVGYTPPAEPAHEELVVAVRDVPDRPGLEVARFPLTTRPGAG